MSYGTLQALRTALEACIRNESAANVDIHRGYETGVLSNAATPRETDR